MNMEKPRRFIHIKRTKTFPEMGVLVVGRTAIPLYLISTVFSVGGFLLFVIGGVTHTSVIGTSIAVLGLTLVCSVILGFLSWGAANLVRSIGKDIKKATLIERGIKEDSRY